jgi:hypothetical protein
MLPFGAIPGFQTQQGINSIKSSASALQTLIQTPTSTTSDISSGITGLGSGLSAGISDISNYNDGSSSNTYGFTTGSSGAATSPTSSTTSVLSPTAAPVSGGDPGSIFTSVSTNLTGIRASMYSPIYGVLSSLTRLVSAGVGDVSSIFSALTSSVGSIVRGVEDITAQALGIVGLVAGGVLGAAGIVIGGAEEADLAIRQTIGSLENAAGCITSVPQTGFQSLAYLISSGYMPANLGYLQTPTIAGLTGSGSATRLALLSSGAVYSPAAGASL